MRRMTYLLAGLCLVVCLVSGWESSWAEQPGQGYGNQGFNQQPNQNHGNPTPAIFRKRDSQPESDDSAGFCRPAPGRHAHATHGHGALA